MERKRKPKRQRERENKRQKHLLGFLVFVVQHQFVLCAEKWFFS